MKLDFRKFYGFAQFSGSFIAVTFLFSKFFLRHLIVPCDHQDLPENRINCKNRSIIGEIILIPLEKKKQIK